MGLRHRKWVASSASLVHFLALAADGRWSSRELACGTSHSSLEMSSSASGIREVPVKVAAVAAAAIVAIPHHRVYSRPRRNLPRRLQKWKSLSRGKQRSHLESPRQLNFRRSEHSRPAGGETEDVLFEGIFSPDEREFPGLSLDGFS